MKSINKLSRVSRFGLLITYTLLCYIFSASMAYGQVTLWQEDFDGYADGITSGTGSGTSTATWATNDVDINVTTISGADKALRGQNIDNTLGNWTTTTIDVSGYANVRFSLDVDSGGGVDSGQDYFILEYRVDGGTWIELENASGDTSPSDPLQSSYTVAGLFGSTLEFQITMYNNGVFEYYEIDNVLVEGFSPTIDSDGDGVYDYIDFDDDNDGILDAAECLQIICAEPVTNGGFEDPAVGAGNFQLIDESLVPGWSTTASDGQIEFWGTGHSSVPSFEGGQHAELNANEPSALYQELCLTEGSVITWSVRHRGRGGIDVAEVKIGADLATATVQETMSDGTSWGFYSGIYIVPAGQSSTFFIFEAVSSSAGILSYGNFIDDVTVVITSEPVCIDYDGDGVPNNLDLDGDNDGIPDILESGNGALDTDNDGMIDASNGAVGSNGLYDILETSADSGVLQTIYEPDDTDNDGVDNTLDLDSDNDGIYDAVESGHNQTHTSGRLSGSFGDDGISDLVQAVGQEDSGSINYTLLNSDALADADYLVLDSDGDGCNDVLEAGYTDGDADGILGSATVGVDTNGIVTSGTDGYTTPIDLDTNTLFDYREATAPSISVEPTDMATCPGCSTSFSVTSLNTDAYQWQQFNGLTWDDLTDTGIFSGTTTNTLLINNPTTANNGNQFRVLASNTSYSCSFETSIIVNLSIRATSVITNRRITHRVNRN